MLVKIPLTFSFAVPATLLVILIVSGRMFHVLTRQWTMHRPIEALREWAAERRFALRVPPLAQLPAALAGLASLEPQVQVTLTRGPAVLLRVSTPAKPGLPHQTWHVLVRELERAWHPAGLRPVAAQASFLDLFSLNGFPSLLPPERFVVFAAESKHARQMAGCSARGLLPADVGLLLHGPYVTLDFSSRPFDAIEFERMMIIMDQIVHHLPEGEPAHE